MVRPSRIRVAVVTSAMVLIGVALAVLQLRPDNSTVGVQLAGTELQLMFPRDCAVGYLRIGDLWEIRAEGAARLPEMITAGTPPPGFQELTDNLGPTLPPTIAVTAKNGLMYSGDIDLATLLDGARHDVALRPVMNELAPVAGLC